MPRTQKDHLLNSARTDILQLILPFWIPCQASPSWPGVSLPSPSLLHTPLPLHTPSFLLVPIQNCHCLSFSPPAKISCKVLCSKRRGWWRGGCQGKAPFFQKQYLRGGLSGSLQDLKFQRLNERNTQLTKRSAAEDASSALAKSLLSFYPFFPNNSCPLIPCYSAVKNKTSLRLSVFLFFPRVGLITGD